MENTNSLELDSLRAQIYSMLNTSTGDNNNVKLSENFVYFAAEAFEMEKDILGKYWGFLNKDVTTTNISEKNIEELRFLATAVYLEGYEEIPTVELSEKHNREFWNLDVSILTRARKSLAGFLLKKATEKHVSLKTSEEPTKKLW